MERDALEVQTRLARRRLPLAYAFSAGLIWAAVLYGALTSPPAHPARGDLALAACPK